MHHDAPSPLRRWSRQHWLLASLLATSATLIVTIIPGFANAMRDPGDRGDFTTHALALPPLDARAETAAREPTWHPVTVKPGQTLGAVQPHLRSMADLVLAPTTPEALAGADVVFLALPHGQSGAITVELPEETWPFGIGIGPISTQAGPAAAPSIRSRSSSSASARARAS